MILHHNDTPIYYELYGKGPALVLVHGFLESSSMWQAFVPLFSETHTVITLDLPGHAQSGCIAETHTMELMADVVSHVLESNHIECATFIGHSMGGYVTLAIADKYESLVHKIILLNSTSEGDSPERIINRNRAIRLVEQNKETFVRMAIGNLFTENTRLQAASEIERLKNEAITFPKKGIQAALRGMRDRKDRTHVLTSFNRDKYLIAGLEDLLIPINTIEVLSEKTRTNLKIMTGGHMLLAENWREIVKYLHFIV